MNTIQLAVNDLRQFSHDNLSILARYLAIHGSSQDLPWLIAIRLHNQRANMDHIFQGLPLAKIVKDMSVEEILQICKVNKWVSKSCSNNTFWRMWGLEQGEKNLYNALIGASKSGNIKVVDSLLKAGADATQNDIAISEASNSGYLDVVNSLLEAGANVRNSQALINASDWGHIDVVNRLLKAGVNKYVIKEAVLYASEAGHLDVVNRLLEAGADATAQNNHAVIMASANGNLDVVDRLLMAGADPSAIR